MKVAILGSYVNALGLVRTFGEAGITPYVIDDQSGLAGRSKYSNYIQSTMDGLVSTLLELNVDSDEVLYVFPTSDEHLDMLVQNETRLMTANVTAISGDAHALKLFSSKKSTYQLCEELDIPVPKRVDTKFSNLAKVTQNLKFPLLIKPDNTVNFKKLFRLGRQTIVLHNSEDLENFVEQTATLGVGETQVSVQEYIEGGAERLYTVTSFNSKENKNFIASVGHKVLQFPNDAGTISAGATVVNDELIQKTKSLLQGANFYGIANTEYKYCEKNNKYFLMEVNPRSGMWNVSALRSGVYLFQDLTPFPTKKLNLKQKPIFWFYFPSLIRSISSNPKPLHAILHVLKYIKSYKLAFAVFDLHDIMPVYGVLHHAFRSILK